MFTLNDFTQCEDCCLCSFSSVCLIVSLVDLNCAIFKSDSVSIVVNNWFIFLSHREFGHYCLDSFDLCWNDGNSSDISSIHCINTHYSRVIIVGDIIMFVIV